MKTGNLNFLILSTFFFLNFSYAFSENKIESVPIINLEDLSPTFEEDKDELEKMDETNTNLNTINTSAESTQSIETDKIIINIKALDKITAKTSNINLSLGETKNLVCWK